MATQLRDRGDMMQNLLDWGTANAPANATPVPEEQTKDNLKVLNQIWADRGPSDAERMNAACVVINDDQGDTTLDEKLQAWDDLELLVESLDNANDLRPMGLWPLIAKHLNNSEPEMAVQALWVCGTAIQNNPDSQNEFLKLDPIPTIVSQIRSSTRPASVRAKAIYCLSAVLKHSAPALEEFGKANGWQALTMALQDSDITCRRKAAFLADSLFSHAEGDFHDLAKAARDAGVVDALISNSGSDMQPFGADGDQHEDADLQEKSIRAACTLNSRDSSLLSADEKKQLRTLLESGLLDESYAASEREEILKQLA